MPPLLPLLGGRRSCAHLPLPYGLVHFDCSRLVSRSRTSGHARRRSSIFTSSRSPRHLIAQFTAAQFCATSASARYFLLFFVNTSYYVSSCSSPALRGDRRRLFSRVFRFKILAFCSPVPLLRFACRVRSCSDTTLAATVQPRPSTDIAGLRRVAPTPSSSQPRLSPRLS